MSLKLLWIIISGVAITVAAYFLWRRDLDRAFIIAAIGLVAWFLNYRMQMKEVALIADVERSRLEDKDEENRRNGTA